MIEYLKQKGYLSLHFQLLAMSSAIFAVVATVVFVFNSIIFDIFIDKDIQASISQVSKRLEVNSQPYLWSLDKVNLTVLLQAEMLGTSVKTVYVRFKDDLKSPIYLEKDLSTPGLSINEIENFSLDKFSALYATIPDNRKIEIEPKHLGNALGSIRIVFTDHYDRDLLKTVHTVVVIALLLLSIVYILFTRYLIHKLFLARLSVLSNNLKSMYEQEDVYHIPVQTKFEHNEFGEVNRRFTALQERFNLVISTLTDRETVLRETLGQLSKAQDSAVQAEKMAALGNLVAGVSHELNTPIGNGLVTVTTLQDVFHDFETKFNTKRLKETDFVAFLARFSHGLDLTRTSLDKAVTLISSFKQIAVDQTSERTREFVVYDLIQETLQVIHHVIKKVHADIQVNVDRNLTITSLPGSLYQVVSNIVTNAVIHGFADRASGIIVISAEEDGDNIVFKITDDGVGIAPENVSKVFDPFYTTRMGSGGSGLGLNIAYNEATHSLGGTISVDSLVGTGTTFKFVIPKFLTKPE